MRILAKLVQASTTYHSRRLFSKKTPLDDKVEKLYNESKVVPWQIGYEPGIGINFLNLKDRGFAVLRPDEGNDPMKPIDGMDGDLVNILDAKIINSRNELYEALDFSSALAAKGLSLRGKLELDFKITNLFRSESTLILLRYYRAASLKRNKGIFKEALRVPGGNQDQTFRNNFGDGYIRGVIGGGFFGVTLRITHNFKQEQKQLASKLAGAFSSGLTSASARVSCTNTINKLFEENMIEIHTIKMGGQSPLIVDLKKKEETFGLFELVSKHAKDLTQFPHPLYAHIVPYSSAEYRENPNPPVFIDVEVYERALNKFYILKQRCDTLLADLKGVSQSPYLYYNPPKLAILKKWHATLEAKIQEIQSAIEQCLSGEGTILDIKDNFLLSMKLPEPISVVHSKLLGKEWHIREGSSDQPWYGIWERKNPSLLENINHPYNFTAKWWFTSKNEPVGQPGVIGQLRIGFDKGEVIILRESTEPHRPKYIEYRAKISENGASNGTFKTIRANETNDLQMGGTWKTLEIKKEEE